MPRQINFTVEIQDGGEFAKIEVPHGSGQQRDANAIQKLTKDLAEAIGEIEERHQPAPHHHHHDETTNHNHLTQGE